MFKGYIITEPNVEKIATISSLLRESSENAKSIEWMHFYIPWARQAPGTLLF